MGSFEELSSLVGRYNVVSAVVDAFPEQHKAIEFAKSESRLRVKLAYYDRTEPSHERERKRGFSVYHINRTLALEEMFADFLDEKSELPKDARRLGGRVKDGVGEYYREMLALTRVREQNAHENWVDRFVDGGKPDHYAHAEAYCHVAISARPVRLTVL